MRTTLLIFLMLITIGGFSQRIEINKIDDFTKNRIIKTGMTENDNSHRIGFKKSDYIDIDNELLLSMCYYQTSDTIKIYYITVLFSLDLGCLSEYDGKMMLILDDNSVLTFMQFSDTDCSTVLKANYYLLNKEDYNKLDWNDIMLNNIEKLLTHNVLKIRIYGTDYYNDFTLKPDKQNIINKHINLINGVK